MKKWSWFALGLGLAGCLSYYLVFQVRSRDVVLIVRNESQQSVTDIKASVTGMSSSCPILRVHEVTELSLRPTSESGVTLSFTSPDRKHSEGIPGSYVEPGYCGTVTATINHDYS